MPLLSSTLSQAPLFLTGSLAVAVFVAALSALVAGFLYLKKAQADRKIAALESRMTAAEARAAERQHSLRSGLTQGTQTAQARKQGLSKKKSNIDESSHSSQSATDASAGAKSRGAGASRRTREPAFA